LPQKSEGLYTLRALERLIPTRTECICKGSTLAMSEAVDFMGLATEG
jgi:hypothetical protein